MRVCFLTHYFPPEVGAPQTRIDLLSRTLAARGVDVTVHTCFPHYPAGKVTPPYRNRPWLVEHRQGVKVVRSAVYPAANRGFARRLLDHTSFALSSLATAPQSGRADVIVAETPPLFTAAAGAAYAAFKRAAFVVNVADRWPASAVELGALSNQTAIAAAEALERFIYRRADLILSPTEGIATTLASLEDAGAKSRRVWPVVDTERFALAQRTTTDVNAPLRVLYAGTLGLAHGLDVLIEASRLAGPGVVQTTIAGDGADAQRLRAIVRDREVANVKLIGTVASDRVPALYAECDAAAVLLRDLEIFAGALPTKLLEAMAAGRPLLLAARGEAAELVQRASAGIVVPPGDPAALAEACVALQSDAELRATLGASGRSYAATHFGAQRAADEWLTALDDAVAAHARRSARAAGARCRAD